MGHPFDKRNTKREKRTEGITMKSFKNKMIMAYLAAVSIASAIGYTAKMEWWACGLLSMGLMIVFINTFKD